MMDAGMDPKNKAIEELLAYLGEQDGMELGEAVKPKGVGIEAIKVEPMEGEEMAEGAGVSHGEPDGDESGMAPEELEELIEAIQSKLGG